MRSEALTKSDEVVAALDALSARLEGADRAQLAQARTLIDELKQLVATLDGQLAVMKWLAQKHFRPKTDKVPEGQLALELLGLLVHKPNVTDPSTNNGQDDSKDDEPPLPPDRPERRKKRTGKIHLLPVEIVPKEIDEEDRVCTTCHKVKQPMGTESSRTLQYTPPKLFIREERLQKYACRCCGNGVIIAEGTPKLVPGSMASSSVLSHLTVSRMLDATPIERTARIWSRHGADIATSTLYDWNARSAEEAQFLAPIARRQLLTASLISFDDTIMPAKVAGREQGTQRGRLWLYIGNLDEVAFCEFTPDWKGCHPQAVLAGFKGYTQSDGYGGIAGLFRGLEPPTKVGCNDHCRRKWVEALKLGDKRAAPIIETYAALYAIEADCRSLDYQARLTVRREKSVPLWTKLQEQIARVEPCADLKSPLGRACTYFRRQQPALAAFLQNGALPISNAHVERLLRTVALFRKNSLFVGSIDAGKRYATQLTLALNCVLAGANPFDYFVMLFDRIAQGWPASRADELMPRAWLAAQKKAEQVEASQRA